MPGKPARRRAAGPQPQPAADGALARVVDRAFDNPAMSGGLVVMAITAMAIMSNAMFLQRGHHPEPLFATRTEATTAHAPMPRPAPAVPMPRSRTDVPVVAAPPPQVEAPPAAPSAAASTAAMVTAVQRELARLGIYTGAIDGLLGPRTRAAISTWQTAAGIAATGEPSAELLVALRAPATAVVPLAPVTQPAVVAAANSDQVAAAVARAAELEREQVAIRDTDRLRRVQVSLNQIGYGPLTVDGQPSQATADSIRRFQLDNGLPVSGALNDRLVERLVSIGAMKPE